MGLEFINEHPHFSFTIAYQIHSMGTYLTISVDHVK